MAHEAAHVATDHSAKEDTGEARGETHGAKAL